MKKKLIKFSNNYFSIINHTDDTAGLDYTFANFKHSGVRIIARNDLGQIALVKQFRYPTGQSLWELPAGGVEPDEDPLDSAKRELQEECELSAKQWTKLTETRSLPNVTNFSATLFLAESLSRTPNAIQSAATREVDKVRFFSPAEIADMTISGELIDEKTLAALFVLSRQLLV